MPPSASAYNAGLLALQQQQRASLTALVEQVDGTLAANWQQGVASAAGVYGPLLDQYAKDLAALRVANDDPAAALTLDWLTSQNTTLASIEQSVQASVNGFAQSATATVTNAQDTVSQVGASDAAALTQRSLWPAVEGAGVPPAALFNRPNPDAVAQWVGRAGNGHPLGDLFANFGAEATTAARQSMVLGLLTGANPKAMASGISQAMGISRSRATIIARTEVLGSYRSAAHETYRANSDVLNGWVWSAGGSSPCACCMGMDGLQFSLEEELIDHACGKCAPLPVTKSWDDILGPLGIDSSGMAETSMGAPGAYETGPEKFARMTPEQQQRVIGTKTGYEALQRGEVSLKDFVGMRPAADGYPPTPYQKSLRELQIPTARSRLVEPATSRLPIGAPARGALVRPEEMPVWARQSAASRASYQVLRNGLPYQMTEHESALLEQSLQQMLTEDIPANVRAATERQLALLQTTAKDIPSTVVNSWQSIIRSLTERDTFGVGQGTRLAQTLDEVMAPLRSKVTETTDAIFSAYADDPAALRALADRWGVNSLRIQDYQLEWQDAQAMLAKGVEYVRGADGSYDAVFSAAKYRAAGVTDAMLNEPRAQMLMAMSKDEADAWAIRQAFDDTVTRLLADNPLYVAQQMEREAQTADALLSVRQTIGSAARDAATTAADDQAEMVAAREAEAVTIRAATDHEAVAGTFAGDDLRAEAQQLRALINPAFDDKPDITAAEVFGDIYARQSAKAAMLVDNPDWQEFVKSFGLHDQIIGGFTFTPDMQAVGSIEAHWRTVIIDESPVNVALRQIVQDAFGLNVPARAIDPEIQAAADKLLADSGEALTAYVQATYDQTQQWFADQGLSEITLYRGASSDEALTGVSYDGAAIRSVIDGPPISSYSADPELALRYSSGANYYAGDYHSVIATRVPVSDIFGAPFTSGAARGESEFLLFGDAKDAAVLSWRGAETPDLAKALDELAPKLPQVVTNTATQDVAAGAGEASSIADKAATQMADTAVAVERQAATTAAELLSESERMSELIQEAESERSPVERIVERMPGNPAITKLAHEIGFDEAIGNDTPEMQAIAHLQHLWNSVADIGGEPELQALRMAIRDEFGYNATITGVRRDIMDEANALYQNAGEGLRALARATYDETQAWFQEQDISDLTIFRGSAGKTARADLAFNGTVNEATLPARGISSWAVSPEPAYMSAAYNNGAYSVLAMDRIPVSEVWSAASSGFGVADESEVIVMGDARQVQALTWVSQGEGAEKISYQEAVQRLAESTSIERQTLDAAARDAATSDLAIQEGDLTAAHTVTDDALTARIDTIPADATVADVQDWIRTQIPAIERVDLATLDAQAARLVANATGNLIPELPDVAANLWRIQAENTYTEALAYVPRDGLSLIINTEKWADLAGIAERAPQYAADGWWVIETPEQIIGHEIGHMVQLNYNISNDTWIAAMDRVAALGGNPLVSQYAGDKIEESFAETFALLVYGAPTDAQLPIAQEMARLLNANDIDYATLRAAVGSPRLDFSIVDENNIARIADSAAESAPNDMAKSELPGLPMNEPPAQKAFSMITQIKSSVATANEWTNTDIADTTLKMGEEFYLRFVNAPEHAVYDLDRGYSFMGYQWFDSIKEAVDSEFAEVQGLTEDNIAPMTVDGVTRYGFGLNGLAAVASDGDTDWANLEEIAQEQGGYGSHDFEYGAIYTGRYRGQTESGDGQLFAPRSLVRIFRIDKTWHLLAELPNE